MTNTALEATASSSGKNRSNWETVGITTLQLLTFTLESRQKLSFLFITTYHHSRGVAVYDTDRVVVSNIGLRPTLKDAGHSAKDLNESEKNKKNI